MTSTSSPRAGRRLTARALTILFGVCVCAAAWTNVIFRLVKERQEEVGRAYRENAALARAFEEHVRRALRTADNALLFLKAEYEKRGTVTETARDYVERMRQDPILNQVALADPSGNLLLSAVPHKKPINIATREHFRVQAADEGVGLFVGKPVVTQVSGTWSFFLSRRLTGPREAFGGIVSVGLNPKYFSDYYGSPELGADRAVLLVGRDRVVRARHFRNDVSVGQDLHASPLFSAVERNLVGQYPVTGVIDGLPRFSSYRAMEDYPLVVVVSVLQDSALAPFERRRLLDLGATAVFTLFVAAFCGLLVRADTRRAKQNEALQRELVERHRAEEALRENQELFVAFMDHIPGAAFLKDDEGRLLYENQTGRRLRGETGPGELVPPVEPEEGATVAEESRLLPDGERVIETRTFPVHREGKPPLLGGISVDITERRRAEEERLTFERQLLQSQKMESLGVLASGIAHDFNNLLMGIMGNVDLALAKSPPDANIRKYLERADAATQRAAELTNQMLAYSGRGRFIVEAVDLSRLVRDLSPLLETVASKRATIRHRLAEDLPPVEADATQLRQVVMNLITNASDALRGEGGVVEVETGVVQVSAPRNGGGSPRAAPSPYVYVEVRDTGCGMDDETRAKIYDPFFTTKQTGRGLGLAAVLGIVRGHRGLIELDSKPGSGTTFRVLLPAAKALPKAADQAPPPTVEEKPLRAAGAVLLAEDDEAVRDAARTMIEECGLRVVTAEDGDQAVELFRASPSAFSLVLLDLTMPRMGGFEACRALRQIAPHVPVLLSSGYDENEVTDECGAQGFVHKPYRLQDLKAKIRAHLPQG